MSGNMTNVCLLFAALRSLSCQRITLHKNLFLSFVLNSVVTIVWLTTVVKKQGHTYNDSVSDLTLSIYFSRYYYYYYYYYIYVFSKDLTLALLPSRQAVSCSCSSTCIYWAVTTSGCFARASTCTLWLLWQCLQKNSISCGIICWGGVSEDLCKYFIMRIRLSYTQISWIFTFHFAGFPLVPAVIHSIARHCYYNDK